jgi:hypothetical protein
MILTANLTVEQGNRGAQIVLTHLPLGIGGETVLQALAARVNTRARRSDPDWDPDEFAELGLPLKDIRDESYGDVARIVCEPRSGTNFADLERQIASTWGARTRRQVQLGAPLAHLMRELVEDDSAAQRAALTALSNDLGS